MYHRVVPRRPDTEPYFARGTAVEPHVFEAQLDWLRLRHSLCRPCDPVVDGVVLTFDDGYRDVVDHVWPACRARGIPFAIYPVAGHLAGSERALWFDDYYDRVVRADWHSSTVARRALDTVDLAAIAAPAAPDMRWWVRGPVKTRLRAAGNARSSVLQALGDAIGAPADATLPARLYLGHEQLAALSADGVEIGGHGRHHRLHAGLHPDVLNDEVSHATTLLDELDVGHRRSYCYPDGSLDAHAVATVGLHFAMAFTVAPGRLHDDGADLLRLPRHLARNRWPDDPSWCGAMHDSEFGRAA